MTAELSGGRPVADLGKEQQTEPGMTLVHFIGSLYYIVDHAIISCLSLSGLKRVQVTYLLLNMMAFTRLVAKQLTFELPTCRLIPHPVLLEPWPCQLLGAILLISGPYFTMLKASTSGLMHNLRICHPLRQCPTPPPKKLPVRAWSLREPSTGPELSGARSQSTQQAQKVEKESGDSSGNDKKVEKVVSTKFDKYYHQILGSTKLFNI